MYSQLWNTLMNTVNIDVTLNERLFFFLKKNVYRITKLNLTVKTVGYVQGIRTNITLVLSTLSTIQFLTSIFKGGLLFLYPTLSKLVLAPFSDGRPDSGLVDISRKGSRWLCRLLHKYHRESMAAPMKNLLGLSVLSAYWIIKSQVMSVESNCV